MSNNQDLHIKYRPQAFEEMLGQDHIVKSLLNLKAKGNWPHAFLFVGGSGCGKTTVSRIIAKELGADRNNIEEIDAASQNGIDDMRALQERLSYSAFGGSPVKVIILDECHAITKPAWQSLLKIIEEPPKHVYFMFCTTESDKVPDTIKTRCHVYTLNQISDDDLFDLVAFVNDEEKLNLDDKALSVISSSAWGSPRRALTYLSKCRGLTELAEVRKILQEPDTEEGDVIELCRGLLKNISFIDALAIVKRMEGQNPESIRMVVLAYMSKVILSAKSNSQAEKILAIMEAFGKPFYSSEKMAPVILALGSILL